MNYFSRIAKAELFDLLLSLIVLIIAFSILGRSHMPSIEVVLISTVGVGTGFLLHELAHKFVAQRYGYWAEYKASWPGLIFMIITSFMGFIFAAPGAVMIHKDFHVSQRQAYLNAEYVDQFEKEHIKEQLWIALAGPMTNIVLIVLFSLLLLAGGMVGNQFLQNLAYFAFYINLILAAFNLIPVDPFDGGKIIRGSRLIWAIVALPTILLALAIYFDIGII